MGVPARISLVDWARDDCGQAAGIIPLPRLVVPADDFRQHAPRLRISGHPSNVCSTQIHGDSKTMRFVSSPVGAFLVLMTTVVPVFAQQDEKTFEATILGDWNNYEKALQRSRQQLANLQFQYHSARNDKARDTIKRSFSSVRETARAQGNRLWENVGKFLERFPNNVAVRDRRMRDITVFDQMSCALKARDAEKLFQVSGNGEYIHEAASWYDKAYDFKSAMKLWKLATEKAATYKALNGLANSSFNAGAFQAAEVAFTRAQEATTVEREKTGAQGLAQLAGQYTRHWEREKSLRETQKDLPRIEIVTDRGTIVAELFEDEAPNTVANFVELAEKGFFDGLAFHRNIPRFMIQGGDPDGTGRGGPGYTIKDEHKREDARKHFVGSLSMANQQKPDTGGSQFFVTSVTSYWLNPRHTVFGRVISGQDVTHVQPVDPKDPQSEAPKFKIKTVRVLRKRDHAYTSEKIKN